MSGVRAAGLAWGWVWVSDAPTAVLANSARAVQRWGWTFKRQGVHTMAASSFANNGDRVLGQIGVYCMCGVCVPFLVLSLAVEREQVEGRRSINGPMGDLT